MKVIICGDFLPKNRVADLFEKGDFCSVLGNVKEILSSADYSIVNFECPIVGDDISPIEKCGPSHKCTKKGMEAICWAGFKCVTLANNHFLDYGVEGVSNTLASCREFNIDTVGGGKNLSEASQILYKVINGKTLAVINCCEHEFSIATETSPGSNPLNPIQQYYAIQEARKKADYVFVIVHGGHEHYQLPSPRMQETYRFFIDAGADAVVNHHQHCYSGYEIYKEKPIFYGLGNFCFDKGRFLNSLWNLGYMVSLVCSEAGISYEIVPYKQCADTPTIKIGPWEEISGKLSALNTVIAEKDRLAEETYNYYHKCIGDVTSIIEPPIGKWFKYLQWKGWIPSLVGKNGPKDFSTILPVNHTGIR